ncbi:hypothetical protein NFI96_007288 [Prochilodus magdalenae]|nr:hypothetical protein NFI96_007288 [Prochilodus magdalenae]
MAGNVSGKAITEFVITGFDSFEKPMAVGVAIFVVYVLVMLANLANICFIMLDKRLHQPMYLFICNLAVVDMLYCSSSCPTMISVLIVGYKTISYAPCIFQMFAFGLGFVMEVLTISVMAFDRLLAILNPLRYSSILTNSRSALLTFSLWVLGCVTMAVVPGTVLPLPFCYSTLKYVFCDYAAVVRATCVDPNPYFNLMTVLTFFLLFGTFSFISMTYIKIVLVVVKMTSKGSKRKVFNTCFSHLIVIVCYYGPTFVLVVLTRIGLNLTLEERHGLRVGTILGPSLLSAAHAPQIELDARQGTNPGNDDTSQDLRKQELFGGGAETGRRIFWTPESPLLAIPRFRCFEKPMAVGVAIFVVYVLVMLANLANICFIMLDKRLHQPMYLFICNLAVVDMLYCSSSCPTMISVLIVGYKTISYASCIFQMFAFGLGFVMELYTISVMAFDRLLAILNPLRYSSILTNFRSALLTLVLWILGSATMAVVPATVLPLPFCYSTLKFMFCDYGSVVRATCVDPNPYFDLMSVMSSVLLCGTFVFICASYISIVSIVVRKTTTGSKLKVFNTCFSHLIVVICYYGPSFAVTVLTRVDRNIRIGTCTKMSTLNASLLLNMSFVRPEYFYISGFSGIPYVKYYFIFLFVTYFVAVFGNSFVLIMILSDRSLHVPKYMAIFNLALADFGETNALIPNLIKTFLFDSQYISYSACLVNMFFVFFFISVQSLTLVVLAYDRYIAIRLPLRYHAIVNISLMSTALMGVWSFSTLMTTMMVSLITRLSFCRTNEVKSYFCDHGPIYTTACNDTTINSVMAKLNTALGVYIPLVAIMASYLGILHALSKITTWAGRLKALKTCVSHLLVVGIFFLPILSTYIAAINFSLHPNARIISTSLSSAIPPMLNPIIYVLNTQEFKGFLLKMLKKRSVIGTQCSTIGRRLHHAGLHAHRPLPRLSLTPRHRHQRLQWCRTRLSWSDSEWQRVIFSDESRFSLGGDAQRIRVWRHRGQHQDEWFVVTRPEDLVSLHLHPYRTICRNCVRMFKLHGMDYHRTPLGTSTAPYRDVWRVGLANTAARRHTERQTSGNQTNPTQLNQTSPTKLNQTSPTKLNQTSPTQLNQTSTTKPTQLNSTQLNQTNPTQPDQSNSTSPAQPDQPNPTQLNQTNPTQPAQLNQTSPTQLNQTNPTQPAQLNSTRPAQPNSTRPTQLNQPSSTRPTQLNQTSTTQLNQTSPTQPDQRNPTQPDQPNSTQPDQPNSTRAAQPNSTRPTQPDQPNSTRPTQLNQPSSTRPTQPAQLNQTNPTQPDQPISTQPDQPNQPSSTRPTQPNSTRPTQP